MPVLETTRLTLRPFVTDDWEAVHQYASLPDVSRYDTWGPNDEAESLAFVERCIEQLAASPVTRYELAVVASDVEQVVGACSLKIQADDLSSASLGYVINPDFQNRGYATEAVVAMMNFGFSELGLTLISAQCDTRNVASWMVMEKAGLRRAETLSEHREVKGEMTDSYRYELRRLAVG